MKLHGRIWIGNLILFGIGGTCVIEIINPLMFNLFKKIPQNILLIASCIIIISIFSDYLMSHFIMRFVKSSIESSEADNTESISEEIRLLLHNKSILHKRVADAYPDVIYRTDRINQRIMEIKDEIERIQQETVNNFDRIKQEATYNFELMKVTPAQIQADIIDKQDQLIIYLEKGFGNEKEIEMMQKEISDKKHYLEERKKLYRVKL